MTSLFRVRTALTGFSGGPGVSTMYFLDTVTAVPSVRAFWQACSPFMPVQVVAQVESIGDEIESTTGALVGAFSKAPVAPVQSANAQRYSAAAGAVVSWLTATVADGRRLRGRTFVVPLVAGGLDFNGSLAPEAQGAIKAAADALLFEQSLSLVVWGRPRAARAADGSRPAVTARAGTHGLVTDTRVPDMTAILRSRRD